MSSQTKVQLKKVWLTNAFSLNMLPEGEEFRIVARRISPERAREIIWFVGNAESAIGHEATAAALSMLLGIKVPTNRIAIKMQPGEGAIVFQLRGRLAEGQVIKSIEELEK